MPFDINHCKFIEFKESMVKMLHLSSYTQFNRLENKVCLE